MSVLDTRISKVKTIPGGRLRDRLMSEISYARRVSDALGGRHDALILKALDRMEQAYVADGALTDPKAAEIEQSLMPMQTDCKRYRLILCGHAHIDMNWMWRYDETVQITLDTFSTVLKLMREFPQFVFSQSQASVYRIVEENAPDMLEEIRRRAQEGRWEVSASTWVEADRNMPSAESTARHHLYTLNYLPELLGVERPRVDFEPDTFGHHQNVPELLTQAGVQYYYHCRGLDGQTLYRWRAPSGAEVLAYREPFWYNDAINGEIAEFAPEFCERFGVEAALRVYGVGDHGGGPTRRDILRILDMQTWPIYATVEFGTYAEFFAQASRATKEIPVVRSELNPLFLGCYTTQTRIKKGNRYGERLLTEAEAMNAAAYALVGTPYRQARFEQGWRNVLFNQFHDILPGSGVADTREYAMGLYQESYAVANSAKRAALRAICGRIDTSGVSVSTDAEDVGGGAGVGFGVEQSVDLAPVEVGQGSTRIYHLFNACSFDREEVVELTIWDYPKTAGKPEAVDADGKCMEHQLIERGFNAYWGHEYAKMYVRARIPAMGYTTVIVKPVEDVEEPIRFVHYESVEQDDQWTLENDLLELECDPAVHDGAMVLTEKATGETYVIEGFRMFEEDASRGMTSWVLGDRFGDRGMEAVRVKRTVEGALYNELTVEAKLGERSRITYRIGLAKGSRQATISAEVHWLETADRVMKRVPQLFFGVMADDCCRSRYTYDIPGGVIERDASAQDMPGVRFIAGGRLMLASDCKYGYRGEVGRMGVTLIRSACDPDPYPELGVHRFRLAVGLTGGESPEERVNAAAAFSSPITQVSGERHEGRLPMTGSFVRVADGTIELQSVKLSEDGRAIILRGVELCGDGKGVRIELGFDVKRAHMTDTLEEKVGEAVEIDGRSLTFNARPLGMFSIRAEL